MSWGADSFSHDNIWNPTTHKPRALLYEHLDWKGVQIIYPNQNIESNLFEGWRRDPLEFGNGSMLSLRHMNHVFLADKEGSEWGPVWKLQTTCWSQCASRIVCRDKNGKILNRPKEMNAAVSTKVLLRFFPPVCSSARFIFTLVCLGMFWVHVMHVMNTLGV